MRFGGYRELYCRSRVGSAWPVGCGRRWKDVGKNDKLGVKSQIL